MAQVAKHPTTRTRRTGRMELAGPALTGRSRLSWSSGELARCNSAYRGSYRRPLHRRVGRVRPPPPDDRSAQGHLRPMGKRGAESSHGRGSGGSGRPRSRGGLGHGGGAAADPPTRMQAGKCPRC